MAGITCCICGKKQSGWITDYPLSQEYYEHRLCVECGGTYQKILNAKNLKEVSAEIQYINSKLAESQPERIVSDYLSALFSEENAEKAINEINEEMQSKQEEKKKDLLISSGYNFEGYKIAKYCDFITAQTVFGMGVFKAMAASIANMTGYESAALNNKIDEAKNVAIEELKKKAVDIGANAIIGIDIDFSMFADTMIVVSANGTAVVIEPK